MNDATKSDPWFVPPWYLRSWMGLAYVAVVAVVVGVVTAVVVVERRPEARPGTVYGTDETLSLAHTATVQLPWGVLDLGVTKVRGSLPHDVARYTVGADPEAPDGGHFVGVHWSVDSSSSPLGVTDVRAVPAVPTLVSLTVGSHSFPLSTTAERRVYCDSYCLVPSVDNDAWVAVAGDVDHLGFRVTYDGVTQSVDLASGAVHTSRAAPLYSAGRSSKAACGHATFQAGFTGNQSTCSVSVSRTAWVGGLGWSEAGSEWVVVDADAAGPYGLSYRSAGRTTRVSSAITGDVRGYRLGGHAPVSQVAGEPKPGALGPEDAPSGVDDVVVFSVPVGADLGSLAIAVRYPLDVEATEARIVPTSVSLSWQVSL